MFIEKDHLKITCHSFCNPYDFLWELRISFKKEADSYSLFTMNKAKRFRNQKKIQKLTNIMFLMSKVTYKLNLKIMKMHLN